MNATYDIIIIGGGPSGMVAAIQAAQSGVTVCLLERMSRVGKKLLATGNGRCNLSNTKQSLNHYHSKDPSIIESVFSEVDHPNSLKFLESLGIIWEADPSGKIYPASKQAAAVLDLLRLTMDTLHINVLCDMDIRTIAKDKDIFTVSTKINQTFTSRSVIFASGGKASPNLGSNGSGFKLAEQLGHTITETYPAQVQLCCDAPWLKSLKGLRHDCRVSLLKNGQVLQDIEGEVLFTDYGLSGIPALQLSRYIHPNKNQPLEIQLDLFPRIEESDLSDLLMKRFKSLPNFTIAQALLSLLHKRFIQVITKQLQWDSEQMVSNLLTNDINFLVSLLKKWTIPVTGTKSWSEAQVTAGGVDVSEIKHTNLESTQCPGLFFCGEILDVDGDCGGYNLQWAWSSGMLAGQSAAQFCKDPN